MLAATPPAVRRARTRLTARQALRSVADRPPLARRRGHGADPCSRPRGDGPAGPHAGRASGGRGGHRAWPPVRPGPARATAPPAYAGPPAAALSPGPACRDQPRLAATRRADDLRAAARGAAVGTVRPRSAAGRGGRRPPGARPAQRQRAGGTALVGRGRPCPDRPPRAARDQQQPGCISTSPTHVWHTQPDGRVDLHVQRALAAA